MPEILLPQIEGARVGDSRPLVALVGTLVPTVDLSIVLREHARLMERLQVTATEVTLEPQIEGVHLADAAPIVALVGAVVTPPLARLIPRERLRVVDRPIRIRRQRLPP